jgi:hypothetical protein
MARAAALLLPVRASARISGMAFQSKGGVIRAFLQNGLAALQARLGRIAA